MWCRLGSEAGSYTLKRKRGAALRVHIPRLCVCQAWLLLPPLFNQTLIQCVCKQPRKPRILPQISASHHRFQKLAHWQKFHGYGKNRTIALSHGSHLGLVSWVSVGQMPLKPRIGIGGFQTFTLRPARFFKVFTNAVLFPVNMCILYICILI